MFTILLALFFGFVLGLMYSSGKENPVESACVDAKRITASIVRWIRNRFRSSGKDDVIDI